ncbi:glycoside hydrolase family 43 protein [Paenibacillus sp. MMS20-IR301]|uniref:glycoside hydrolase family 43 protein n=1 Tax=Paenibacillus sp. MMS20-IR301 TaxID=2895946 RepID=UPI0028E56B4F|nr:glycoside hydrolase family 43 protein [Paenibacillus sp. MMS20-IR301]WNS45832.1 glycoside hydrolase family 43 protein [Paenibacillus sp. MMS20-IR301]
MIDNQNLQIRDPFVLPAAEQGIYYLYGSTDSNIWGRGTGFNVYTGKDLEHWEGPFPVFRPEADFYAERNFWAPEVYAYGQGYIMFATFRRKDNDLLGTAVLTAPQPLGPFKPHSEGPVTPQDWSSLDGTLYVDAGNQPWMIFCHEWQQTGDGEVCAMRLTEDLKSAMGEPVTLFRASEAPWTTPFVSARYPDQINYVTDGPYLFRSAEGVLYLLWASFINNRYALGIVRSASGEITGPWIHQPEALYQNDGGHAMVFETFDGKLMLAIHTPNQTPEERPIFLELEEAGGEMRMKGC